jgi:hypothetical protein
VEQRLLFYGIYVPGARFPVYQGIEGAPPVFSDTADASFTIAYRAVMPAKVTVYPAVLTFLVKGGFFHDGPSFRAGAVFSVAAR